MSDTPFTDSCTYGFTDEDGIHCEAVHADIARTLERELDRYKSDAEVITKERDEARNKAHNYEQGYLTHAARADTLEKERDEAREALRDMLSGWKYIRSVHGDLYGVGWDRAQSKAETALEGTK